MYRFLLLSICSLLLFSCGSESSTMADHAAYHNPTVQSLTDAIAATPNDAELYYKRSIALSQIDQDSLSLLDLQKAVSIDSTKAQYYQAIGFVQINLGDNKGAVAAFKRNLQFEPQNATYILLLAKSLLLDNKLAEAKDWVAKASANRTNYLEADFMTAQIKAAEKDTMGAIALTRNILERNHTYYDASLQLADWYKSTNNENAVSQYQKTFALDTTDATPLYEIARFYEQAGRLEEAKQAFRACVISDPDYSYGYVHYGDILMKQDSYAKAQRQYEIAIATDPANADAWYGKGYSYEQQNQKDSAIRYYGQSLRFDPGLTAARDALKRLK